jgi:hypothetical protein
MKKLAIKPVGGLCTRLLAVDSAIKLQKKFAPDKTIIIWERNRNINCAFKNLFNYPDQLEFKETKGFNKYSIQSYFEFYNSFSPSNYRWPYANKLLGKEKKYDSVIYADELDHKLKNNPDYLPEMNIDSLYISFYKRFGTKSTKIFEFQPVDKIAKQIDQNVSAFNENTFGVHLRRTDHTDAIRHSPIDGFIKAMEEKLENADATFFLSTDSEQDKKRIINRFGQRIITREPTLERTSPQGIADAVIDLFCLSKTKGIIGSYKSTFSQVAAEIGRIENKEVFID